MRANLMTPRSSGAGPGPTRISEARYAPGRASYGGMDVSDENRLSARLNHDLIIGSGAFRKRLQFLLRG
jgi:hypothetical protein